MPLLHPPLPPQLSRTFRWSCKLLYSRAFHFCACVQGAFLPSTQILLFFFLPTSSCCRGGSEPYCGPISWYAKRARTRALVTSMIVANCAKPPFFFSIPHPPILQADLLLDWPVVHCVLPSRSAVLHRGGGQALESATGKKAFFLLRLSQLVLGKRAFILCATNDQCLVLLYLGGCAFRWQSSPFFCIILCVRPAPACFRPELFPRRVVSAPNRFLLFLLLANVFLTVHRHPIYRCSPHILQRRLDFCIFDFCETSKQKVKSWRSKRWQCSSSCLSKSCRHGVGSCRSQP